MNGNDQMFNNGMAMPFQGMPQTYYGTGAQFQGMQPQQVPTMKNFLSQEEIQKLIQKENNFSLNLTETEKLKASCNHRWNEPRNGQFDAITEGVDGICRCAICGYEFEPVDVSTTEDSLREVVKNTLDVLQTIKLLYLDMPAEVAREFYQIIPLIERIPKLFEIAAKSYAKYDGAGMYGFNNRNMNTMQMFNMLTGILNGSQPMPQQTAYNPYAQQPMGQQQFGAPMMGYQAPMGTNGFVAQPGYMPGTMGYQYNPGMGQPAPQAAPAAAPTADATAASSDGKNVTVDATFKA